MRPLFGDQPAPYSICLQTLLLGRATYDLGQPRKIFDT